MGRHWDFEQLTKYGSVPTSIWITLMFVLSLYLWPNHRQRLAPATIFRRLVSITISTIISIGIVYFYSRYRSDKSFIQLILSFRLRKLKIKDIVWPLIITATIFLGPIVDDILASRRWFRGQGRRNVASGDSNSENRSTPGLGGLSAWFRVWRSRPDIWTILRNWLVGPLLEEIVFRCINCTLLSNDFPTHYNVLISGLLFGAAHFHPQIMQHIFLDMERQLLVDSLIQFLYTSAFGMYVATIFMKTRSLWPAVAVHVFCNAMGAPSSDIVRTKWLKLVTTTGIAGWLILYTNYLMTDA